MKRLFLIVLFVSVFLYLAPHKAVAFPRWTTFTTRDGLASNSATSIFEDTQGNLWFWSDSVTKYDGLTWTRFHGTGFVISEVIIGILLEDSDGNKWVRRQNDVVEYNPSHWRPLDISGKPIVDTKGNVWFQEDGQLRRFQDGTWMDLLLPEDVNGIGGVLEDREGNIWMSFSRESDERGATIYEYRPSVNKWISHTIPYAGVLFEDRSGDIWIGSLDEGVYRYDGETWSRFTIADGLVDDGVIAILEDRRGDMWFGTLRGVSKYSHGNWTTFTEDDGLADNWVFTIHEDRMGNLWFGTDNGVSRYNDVTLKSLPINHLPGVASILKDTHGNLWFGTAHGVTRYNGKTWTTVPFIVAHLDPNTGLWRVDDPTGNAVLSTYEDRLGELYFGDLYGTLHILSPGDFRAVLRSYTQTYWGRIGPIWAIAEGDSGNLWLGTEHGAKLYRSGPLIPAAELSARDFPVRAILKDTNGHLWFGTDGAGISVRQGESGWINFRRADGLADDRIRALMQDSQGSIWAGTLGGVSVYQDSRWSDLEMPSRLSSYPVMAIFEDAEGSYWFGTEGGGVGRYDGSTWSIFTSDNGLAGNSVWSIAQDDRGYLWFGTASGGVSRYDGIEWVTFTQVTDVLPTTVYPGYGPPDYSGVHSISEDVQGNLWFSTHGSGLIRYDGTSWTTFSTSNGLEDDHIRDVFMDSHGTLWVITRRGLYRSIGEEWEYVASAYIIYEDNHGNLWFGTTWRGAVKYDGTTETTYLEDKWIQGMFQDSRGHLWFGIHNEHVVRYDGITFTPFPEVTCVSYASAPDAFVKTWFLEDRFGNIWVADRYKPGVARYDGQSWDFFTAENTNGRLPDGNVNVLHQDNEGNIWVGTAQGAGKFDGLSWQGYTVKEGLIDNAVHAILQDGRGIMWFGTDNGVVKSDGTTWITVTTLDGLPDDKVYTLWQDRHGDMWLGTGDGPVQHHLDREAPKVQIIAGPEEGSVVADNNVTFVFEGGDLVCPKEELIFAVWPDPNRPFPAHPDSTDMTQWSPYSSMTTVSLTNLPDGEHVFWVAVKDKDLNSASASRRFTVDTQPPRAFISSPVHNQVLGGVYTITGVATDKDFQHYHLEVKQNADGAIVYSQTVQQKVENGALGTWDTRELNDEYIIILRVTSVKGTDVKREFESTDSVTVTLDNTPPMAKLTEPLDGSRLTKKTSLVGEVSDHHLDGYVLEYTPDADPNTALWRQIFKKTELLQAQETEVQINHEWEVPTITGAMFIRLTAIDAAGNTDMHIISVEVPQALTKDQGGHASSSDGNASLYVPPRSLPGDIIITINRVADEEIAEPSNPQLRLIGRAYDIGPGDLVLLKPATFAMSLDEDDMQEVSDLGKLCISTWSFTDSLWRRVGGTFDERTKEITVALTRFGRFAVMEDRSEEMGKLSISDVNCQPRVFSPKGGSYDVTTTISFNLGKRSAVTVKVYDVSGRFKRKLVEGRTLNRGSNAVAWDGTDYEGEKVVSGLYVVTVESEGKVETKTVGVLNK